MYNPTVMDHFLHPRNVGRIEDPDLIGEGGASGQGNHILFTIRLSGDRIAQVRFQTYGCPAAIASASMTAEYIDGKRICEVSTLDESALTAMLGGLPLGREHCARLAVEALRSALGQWMERKEHHDESPA